MGVVTTRQYSVAAPAAGAPSSLLDRLAGEVEDLTDELTARIRASEPGYSDNELLTPEQLRTSVRDNLAGLLIALADPAGLDTTAAAAAGRLKAQQGIPLDSLLHAYRLGGLIVWERLSQDGDTAQLVPLASRLWSGIDRYSSTAAQAYRQYAGQRRHADQNALVMALLEDPAARAEELVRELGLPTGGTCVVLAADPGDPLHTVAARLAKAGLAAVTAVASGRQFAVVASGSTTSPAAVARLATGCGRIGLSRSCPAQELAPHAKRQALAAQRCVPGSGTHVFGSAPIALLVTADQDLAQTIAGEVLRGLAPLTAPARELLLETLQAWFDSGGSTAGAAKILHCHRNTVLYRLNQLSGQTGRSVSDPRGSAELYAALTAIRLSPR